MTRKLRDLWRKLDEKEKHGSPHLDIFRGADGNADHWHERPHVNKYERAKPTE